jgi:hypothetical protein
LELACPIVGVGASAGGLESLTQFLEHMPTDTGMAFVVVQPPDPTHRGMLPELLQRATKMKVLQVTDRRRVQPDRVYVIPPNRDLSLLHGTLHLLALRLPIDLFFRSLAEDQRERSIGVVRSGMGGDGTLGLKAIKGHGGLALVQDPTTAKFDAMPRRAVDTGLADIVAAASGFLDNDLHVRRFTLQAKTIIKFIPSDVGRPITDLASDLLYPELVADAHEVLRKLVFSERAISTKDGRWFTVRVMPYRTMDNRIDGVVITFADITVSKNVEAGLRSEHARLIRQSSGQDANTGQKKSRRGVSTESKP